MPYDWSDKTANELNVFMDWFFPLAYVRKMCIIGKQRALFRECQYNHLINANFSPDIAVVMYSTGSSVEGLNIPFVYEDNEYTFADLDQMFILRELTDVFIETDSVHPGYLRIKILDECKVALQGKVICPETYNFYLVQSFIRLLDGNINEIHMNKFNGIGKIQHGPATMLMYMSETNDKLYDDIVYALPCKWPTVADEWVTRKRQSGWPSQEMIRHIVSQGCHIVPVSHPHSEWPEVEFRFSFSIAERFLLQPLPVELKRIYIIFKVLCKDCINSNSKIKSYHLKTAFLFTLENVSTDENSVDPPNLFFHLVDTFLYFL